MNNQATTQKTLQADSLPGFAGSFFPARIMNPSEVTNATKDYASVVNAWTKGKWYLCGDVQSELFTVIKAEIRDAVAVRLTAFDSPAGGSYAVVSHQLFGWAHRFVLPLYEPKVRELFLGLQRDELGFLFGNEGGNDAVLLHSPLDGPAFVPLLSRVNPLPRSKLHDVMAELPMVISAMNHPHQVPSLRRGELVTDVSVSVVLPSEALIRFLSEKKAV